MSRLLGIAAIQMAAVPHDPRATLDKIESLVANTCATTPWIDLICLPELVLDPPVQFMYREGAPQPAEPIPGPKTDRLRALAARHRKWLIPGSLSECDDERRSMSEAA